MMAGLVAALSLSMACQGMQQQGCSLTVLTSGKPLSLTDGLVMMSLKVRSGCLSRTGPCSCNPQRISRGSGRGVIVSVRASAE